MRKPTVASYVVPVASLVLLTLALAGAIYIHARDAPAGPSDQETYSHTVASAKDLAQRGQPDAAAQSLQTYARSSPDALHKAYTETLAGALYERNGELQKAQSAYAAGKALPAAKGGLAANEGLARVETKLGDKTAAISYWRQCIKLEGQLTDDPLQKQNIVNYQRYISALGGQP